MFVMSMNMAVFVLISVGILFVNASNRSTKMNISTEIKEQRVINLILTNINKDPNKKALVKLETIQWNLRCCFQLKNDNTTIFMNECPYEFSCGNKMLNRIDYYHKNIIYLAYTPLYGSATAAIIIIIALFSLNRFDTRIWKLNKRSKTYL